MDAITFTDSSVEKIRSVIAEEGNDALALRVFVQGGGCSGFKYGFTLEDDIAEDDFTFQKNGVSFVVDPISFQYLVGATIDYSETSSGEQFIIDNPQAASTCGSNQSFSV